MRWSPAKHYPFLVLLFLDLIILSALLFIANQHLPDFLLILKVSYQWFFRKRSYSYYFISIYCFNICSSYPVFHEERTKLNTLLLRNDYPERFLDYCFCSFLNKVFDPLIKLLIAPKLKFSKVLPFTVNHGLKIRQRLLKLVSSFHPNIDLRVTFRPVCRLSHFFSIQRPNSYAP